jgi:hypothetical protein
VPRQQLRPAAAAARLDKEVVRLAIGKPESSREAGIRRTRADIYASRLDEADVGDAPRLFDLADRYIAQADRFNEPLVLQPRKRADARREWRPRIGRVKLVEVNTIDAERLRAAAAGVEEVCGAAVRFHRTPRLINPPFVATRIVERSPVHVAIARAIRRSLWFRSVSSGP